MKRLQTAFCLFGFAALLFTACKKEEIRTSSTGSDLAEQATMTARIGGAGVLASASTYTLTRHGNDTLIYYNDGLLAKVQNLSTNVFTQYNYGFNTITAKTFAGNLLTTQVIYQVDPKFNRVFESETTGYSYSPNGTIVTKKTHMYEYDAINHLTKKFNKSVPNERIEFTWAWGGESLANLRWFDSKNVELQKIAFANVWQQTALHLHADNSTLDVFLNLFDKASKDAPGYESVYNMKTPSPTLISNTQYIYTLNSDNYPTKRDSYNAALSPSQLIKSTVFKYKVTR